MRLPWQGSITGRLIMMLTLATTVLWLAAALLSGTVLRHELNESFDRAEAEVARRLLPLMTDSLFDRDEAGPEIHEIQHFGIGRDPALVYQLSERNGHLLLKSDDAPLAPLNAGASPGFSTTADYRVFTLSDPATGLTIQIGELLGHRNRAIWASFATLVLPLLILIPLSGIGIWLATRQGLRPLVRLRQEISRRNTANLEPLAVDGLPAELTPIAVALSNLIARLKSALDAERQFAANSAHELRTPIAAALAQTQRLIATTPDEATRGEARKIEGTLRRLAGLAEKLMQLARADAGMALSGQKTRLLPVLQLVIDDSGAQARPTRVISLDVAPRAEDVAVDINVDGLGIVLRNLIDNAIVHSPPETDIEIRLSQDAEVSVRNHGAVVPAEALARLSQRFERGATTASGSGLGLAIVETILNQVGGGLSLHSPASGWPDGFEAAVHFGSARASAESARGSERVTGPIPDPSAGRPPAGSAA